MGPLLITSLNLMHTAQLVKPLLRGHFHQAMFFIALGASILLVPRSETSKEFWATAIYSIGLLTMFGISALYHRINWSPQKRQLLKKLDHAGIYTMIAGTFTPVTLLALSPESGKTLLTSIWAIALFGVFQSVFFVNLPKLASSVLYLIAGYMILPYLPELWPNLSATNLGLLVGGGVVYSLGAMAYALKRPVLNPQVFGYHELFHVFVSVAAVMHFIVVYSLV
jgi:hemolysin III